MGIFKSKTNRYRWKAIFSLAILLSLSCYSPGEAFKRFDENEVKAAFIYNLTNFVYWPEESFVAKDSPFEIVILGKTNFAPALEKFVSHEQVDSHPIVVKRINDISDFNSAHLLFISSDKQNNLDNIIPQTRQIGLLSVSDFPGFNYAGGGIALLKNNNRLQLYLRDDVIERNGLRCSSKLLQLATIVKGTRE